MEKATKLWNDYEHFGFTSAWEHTTSLRIVFHVCENKVLFRFLPIH